MRVFLLAIVLPFIIAVISYAQIYGNVVIEPQPISVGYIVDGNNLEITTIENTTKAAKLEHLNQRKAWLTATIQDMSQRISGFEVELDDINSQIEEIETAPSLLIEPDPIGIGTP